MSVCVLGSVNWDVFAKVIELPQKGETVLSLGLDQFPGGKGLNQAVASARFEVRTSLLGAVGVDGPAATVRAYLAHAGVDLHNLLICPDLPTGQAHICLDMKGENTIIVSSGANAAYDGGHAALADVEDATVFVTQFEACPDAIETLFKRPEAAAGVKILNAAPVRLEHRRLLDLADIIVVNETELSRFSGTTGDRSNQDDLVSAARSLLNRPGQRLIATLGARGCISIDARSVSVVPAFPTQVLDTVGAGDCFCGILGAALASGFKIEDALIWASAGAAISVGRRGAAPSAPHRSEIETFLARRGGAPGRLAVVRAV